MKSRGLVLKKTRSLCIAMLVAIFVTSCESRVDLLQPTTPATVKQPQCLFNDVSYNVGDNWNPFLLPEGYYRCKRCSCKLSSDGSMALINCDRRGCKKPSLHARPSPNEQQNSCTHQGIQRNHGAVWAEPVRDQNVLGANQCQECSCTDGFVTCALRDCPVLSCKNQTNTDGTCCPVCAGHVKGLQNPMVCQTMGRQYNHMETWYPRIPPRYDMCINCTCQNTSIQCTIPDCPKVTCKSPQRKAGDCCETCPANSKTVKKSSSSPSTSYPTDSIRMLIRLRRVRKRRPRIPAIFQIRTEKKVNSNPDECVWGVLKFPHNSTFHPTVKPFGVVNCVKCFCNPANSEIECEHLKCPTSYPCKTPVSVPGKCCKVCEGSDPQIKNGTNGRTCHSGKHWRVYEYMKKPQNNTLEVREQFALEDRDHDMVEIHTLYANMTSKVVKVSNTAKRHFHLVLQNNNGYKYIGKIREVQKNKIKTWEQRDCHSTQGCIHTVRKIMNGLRERVKRCDHYRSLPPDSLLQPGIL